MLVRRPAARTATPTDHARRAGVESTKQGRRMPSNHQQLIKPHAHDRGPLCRISVEMMTAGLDGSASGSRPEKHMLVDVPYKSCEIPIRLKLNRASLEGVLVTNQNLGATHRQSKVPESAGRGQIGAAALREQLGRRYQSRRCLNSMNVFRSREVIQER